MRKEFANYLDLYKAELGLDSDYALAQRMGKTRQYVSQMRNNGQAPDEVCLEIARVIGVEGYLVLAARNAAKDSGPAGDAWRKLLERVAVIALLSTGFAPVDEHGQSLHEMTQVVDAANKDYRKYRFLLLIQRLMSFFRRLTLQYFRYSPKPEPFPRRILARSERF